MKVWLVALVSAGATGLTVMLTVAMPVPPALVAETVTVTAPAVVAVGVPVTWHDRPSTVRLAVRSVASAPDKPEMVQPRGVALSASGAPPVLAKVMAVMAWSCVKVTVASSAVSAGAAGLTVMLTVAMPVPPALVAVTVTVTAPAVVAVGVPVTWHDRPSTVRLAVRSVASAPDKPEMVQPRGVALSASGAPPVLAKVMAVMAWSCVKVTVASSAVKTGADGKGGAGGLTVMSTMAMLVPPALRAVMVAVTVTGLPMLAVGAPVILHDGPLSV